MELRIFCEPQQGATYEQILALALAAEEGGFGAFFRSDHYLKMGATSGLPGPTDAWITLAGLARDTRPHSPRHPVDRGHVPIPRLARHRRRGS